MSVRMIALVLALALVVPAALAIWRIEWRAARGRDARKDRALEVAYAAVPMVLLAVLFALSVAA